MTEQMIVRIEPEIKKKLKQLARIEGKSSSQIVRDLIGEYVQERDIAGYIDDLWSRVGKKFKSRGIKPEHIQKVIKDVRKDKA